MQDEIGLRTETDDCPLADDEIHADDNLQRFFHPLHQQR
jgi:hypothetical protein